MKTITQWLKESRYLNRLSPGCKQCAQGSKLVIFITGLCHSTCFYCPLSFHKQGIDAIFADEWKLSSENETNKLIKEAELINATGAGITGGDPFVVWKRSIKYIRLLNDQFGKDFHIHLYTSGKTSSSHIQELIEAGVDEIRFHPLPETWNSMDNNSVTKSIKTAVKSSADVAIEIPSIPNMKKAIISLINWAEQNHIDYINLNELEFSERNENALYQRGYRIKHDLSAAVEQSQYTAYDIINTIAKTDIDIGIHYCSASFKDAIQLTNRMKRRAKNTAHSYDHITKEGTIIKGIIDKVKHSDVILLQTLFSKMGIKNHHYYYSQQKKRIEIHPEIIDNIIEEMKKKGFSCYLIEIYPTADSLEVERIPLC